MPLASQRRTHLEDPGADFLDRLTGFWNRSGRIVLAVVGVVAVGGAVTFFTLRARTAAENLASGRLAEANYLFWQGDYSRSLQVANSVSEQYPSTWSGVDALRIAGDDAFWNGDWKAAVDYYRRYLEKNRSGVLSDVVRRGYAYALESAGETQAAAGQFDMLVGKFDRESSAELLSGAARCYAVLGRKDEAGKRLRRLLEEFGETSHAPTARVRLGELGSPTP